MASESLTCQYSNLPSPMAFMDVHIEANKVKEKSSTFSKIDLDRIIEMAWEDRTPFDAIKFQFGINEASVKALMKKHLKFSSYKLWRSRVESCKTKHVKTRGGGIERFKSNQQRTISLNKISKRK